MTGLSVLARHCGAAVRPRWVVSFALFALITATTDQSYASCGDWLVGHEETATDVAPAGDPAIPCDGPSCRRSRHDLPLAPSTPSRLMERSERWLQLFEELSSRPDLTTRVVVEADPQAVEGDRLPIERPPRV